MSAKVASCAIRKLHEVAIASVREAVESLGPTVVGVAPSRLRVRKGIKSIFFTRKKPAKVESQ